MKRADGMLRWGALLALGWSLGWLAWPPVSPVAEKRNLEPWPAAPRSWDQCKDWPHAFDRAWGDRFPWRWAWIAFDADWRYYGLGLGRLPGPDGLQGVTVGQAGMLFLDQPDSYGVVTGSLALSAERRRAWNGFVGAKAALARRHHAVLMVVLVPDMATVYADRRPWGWQSRGPGVMDQWLAGLQPQPDTLVLDLRPALAKARAACRPFFNGDIHWTPEGAAFGWEAILRAAHGRWPDRSLPPLRSAADWPWEPWDQPNARGLWDLLGVWPSPAESGVRRPRLPMDYFQAIPRRAQFDGPLGRRTPWLFYHDSFGERLSAYIRLQGWTARFLRNSYGAPGQALDESAMRWAHPSVVVVELAERSLAHDPPL
jgi:hypothetical protein